MPSPPSPFDPETVALPEDTGLFRVFSTTRNVTEFNPGHGAPSRFAFFGSPTVPVLYAAESEIAAVAESLLHSVPVAGGVLPPDQYRNKALGKIRTRRPLTLGVLHGLGLRRIGVTAAQVTATDAGDYPDTVQWAEAAHAVGLDGLVWMSRLCNDAKAYIFFGDRCHDAFNQDASHGRVFATGIDQLWLIELCAPLHVDVLRDA